MVSLIGNICNRKVLSIIVLTLREAIITELTKMSFVFWNELIMGFLKKMK